MKPLCQLGCSSYSGCQGACATQPARREFDAEETALLRRGQRSPAKVRYHKRHQQKAEA